MAGARAQIDTGGRDALSDLLEAYRDIETIRCVFEFQPPLEEAVAQSVQTGMPMESWREVIVSRDLRSAGRGYSKIDDQDPVLIWFHFVDTKQHRVVGSLPPDASVYQENQIDSSDSVRRMWMGSTRWLPWIGVVRWVPWILDEADARVWQDESGLWNAQSASLGIGFTWTSSDKRIVRTWKLVDGDRNFIAQFEDPYERDGIILARAVSESATLIWRDQTKFTEGTYRIREIELNPPGIDERLAFDLEEFHAMRRDPATGDVYTFDGNLAYNEKEVLRTIERQEQHRQPRILVVYGGVGLLVVVGGFVAWRRLRSA